MRTTFSHCVEKERAAQVRARERERVELSTLQWQKPWRDSSAHFKAAKLLLIYIINQSRRCVCVEIKMKTKTSMINKSWVRALNKWPGAIQIYQKAHKKYILMCVNVALMMGYLIVNYLWSRFCNAKKTKICYRCGLTLDSVLLSQTILDPIKLVTVSFQNVKILHYK